MLYLNLYSDPDSGLASIHFALGETPRDVSHLDWVPLSPASFLTYIFEIPDGSYAWVKLRPVNNGKNNDTILVLAVLFSPTQSCIFAMTFIQNSVEAMGQD